MLDRRSFLMTTLALGGCASSGAGAVKPGAIGWDAEALAETVAYAQAQKTTGFLIVDRRQVVFEANWPPPADAAAFRANFVHGLAADGALLEDVASQQKSFVAILAGIAVDKGLLEVERPVGAYVGPGWSRASRDQESAIAVSHLLEMTSGLRDDLTYEAAPGARFHYNTPAYAVLKPVLEAAARQPLDALTRAWLTEPAGMADTAWRPRPAAFADVGNPTGLVTTPRDIAKLGQLVLDGGRTPDGLQVISRAQLRILLRPIPANPAYGRLWWINGSSYRIAPRAGDPRIESSLVPSAPADLVAALGAQDRKLYVVPSRGWVVVRTGQAAPDAGFDNQLWTRLMKAAPG